MKDYEKYIFWVDYFNSKLSRSEGRRLPRSLVVENPSLDELCAAAARLNFTFERVEASHPKRHMAPSGYIMVSKVEKKGLLLRKLAVSLQSVRGERVKYKKPGAVPSGS